MSHAALVQHGSCLAIFQAWPLAATDKCFNCGEEMELLLQAAVADSWVHIYSGSPPHSMEDRGKPNSTGVTDCVDPGYRSLRKDLSLEF